MLGRLRIWGFVGIGLLGLALASQARAAEPKIAGDWQGALKINSTLELRLIFHVTEEKGGGLSATLDSPDQGSGARKVDSVTLKDGEVVVQMKSIAASYTGKFDAKGETIAGTWAQGGNSFPLSLARFDPSKVKKAVVPKELEGIWEGKMSLDAGMQLRMVLKVVKDKDGQLAAFFRSPDQLDRDFPVATTRLEGKNVTVEVKSVGGIFEGTLDTEKGEMVGKWKQGPANLPLTLKKAAAESKLNRPQTPKGPFPYESVEVEFDTPGKFKLAGTLTRPKGQGKFPVAIMITGSGQQDRDETLFGHKPFLVIADYLTRRGIAVLRIDDRGVGKSGGSATKATSADFAEDIYAAVTYLKTRSDIDPRRIGLIGHSEGGLIGPMVAAKHPDDVAFLVLLAGPGMNGSEIIKRQGALILKAMGAKPEAIATQARVMKEIARLQETEKDEATLVKKLKELGKKEREALPADQRKALGDSIESSEARLTMMATPWFRFFLTYDPVPTLKQVRCPVLALNGEKDLQVPPKEDLEAIAKALTEGGNTSFEAKELPNLNHLFQTAKTGAPNEYASIDETIAPSALQFIGDWVVRTTHAK